MSKFKVGDVVRLTDSYAYAGVQPGGTATVTSYLPSGTFYVNNHLDPCSESFWELVSTNPSRKRPFPVGDKVRSLSNSSWAGEMVVERLAPLGGNILLCRHPFFPSSGGFYEHDLELISAATPGIITVPAGMIAHLKISPHTCSDNLIRYDSGWSAYNYCKICDQKFHD